MYWICCFVAFITISQSSCAQPDRARSRHGDNVRREPNATAEAPAAKELSPPPGSQPRHTERFAWVGWRVDGEHAWFGVCDRRTREFAEPGKLERCRVIADGGGRAFDGDSWSGDERFVRDETSPDFAPGRCRVWFQDLGGTASSMVASAYHVDENGLSLRAIADWHPEPSIEADYLALETSFSPDGKWVALLRSAVGLGSGDLRVDVLNVELRRAPTCP